MREAISKQLSYVLRHRPGAIGIALDRAGWVAVAELLAALARHGTALDRAELEAIVGGSDKRFALSPDGTRIRAQHEHPRLAARQAADAGGGGASTGEGSRAASSMCGMYASSAWRRRQPLPGRRPGARPDPGSRPRRPPRPGSAVRPADVAVAGRSGSGEARAEVSTVVTASRQAAFANRRETRDSTRILGRAPQPISRAVARRRPGDHGPAAAVAQCGGAGSLVPTGLSETFDPSQRWASAARSASIQTRRKPSGFSRYSTGVLGICASASTVRTSGVCVPAFQCSGVSMFRFCFN
jgi:hypothetical protein